MLQYYHVLVIISIVLWLMPPIRNYKTNFFIYFLLLAVSDPISTLLIRLHLLRPYYVHAAISFMLFLSLKKITRGSKSFNITAFFALCLLIISFFSGLVFEMGEFVKAVIAIINILIFFVILSKALLIVAQNATVNIFYFALLFYEATTIIKFIVTIFPVEEAVIQFLMTGAFQFLFAIFFTLFNENSPAMKINLKIT